MGALGDRKTAGAAAARISNGIGRSLHLPVGFSPSTVRRISDQRHLLNVVDYFFRQEQHHGTDADPFHEASSLPDVLGARVGAPWLRARLLNIAPRLDLSELARYLPTPVMLEAVNAEALSLLHDAAAAAIGEPTLVGRKRSITHARAAAIRVARELGLGSFSDISHALAIDRKTTWRLSRRPCEDDILRAVELQLRLRAPSAAHCDACRARLTGAPSRP
jgi:hypothetical protein